jgi:GNAT superfamily N-acetyltransferase
MENSTIIDDHAAVRDTIQLRAGAGIESGRMPRGSAMLQLGKYSAIETLRDGRRFEIRALTSDDRSDLTAAVARTSAKSLRRRFFVSKRSFTDQETAFFLNVDFVNHVALVAVLKEGGRPVIAGGGRYIVVRPGEAEIAFAVVDQYQGQGIGKALMRHLAGIARAQEAERRGPSRERAHVAAI